MGWNESDSEVKQQRLYRVHSATNGRRTRDHESTRDTKVSDHKSTKDIQK